jgi:hypothetical protein
MKPYHCISSYHINYLCAIIKNVRELYLKEVISASSYFHRSPLSNRTLSHYKMKPYHCILMKEQCNKYIHNFFWKREWDVYQLPTYFPPTSHLHLPTSTNFLPTNKWQCYLKKGQIKLNYLVDKHNWMLKFAKCNFLRWL